MKNYIFKVTFVDSDTKEKTEKLFPNFNYAMDTVKMLRRYTKNYISNPVYVSVDDKTFDTVCNNMKG